MEYTAYKKAQDALAESENRYRALSDMTSEGVAIHENGVIVELNQTFADIFGYTVSELIGMDVVEITAPDKRKEAADRVSENGNYAYETNILRKDGSQILIENKSMPLVYKGREMRVSRLRDLTESRRAAAAVRKSEDRYKSITDNMPALIAYIDRDQRYVSINRLFETWYQKPVSEIIGRRMREIMLPETYAAHEHAIVRVLAGETVLEEYDDETPDGIHRYRRVHYVPDFGDDGTVLGFFALVEDISDVQRATRELELEREALLKSQANLVEAQRIGQIGSWEWNIETGEVQYSDEFLRLFGLEPDQAVRGKWAGLELLNPDDAVRVEQRFAEALDSAASFDEIYRIKTPDGIEKIVHGRGEVFFDQTDRPARMAGTAIDITLQKATEQAVWDSEKQLRLVTDALPTPILYVDTEGKYKFANRSAEELVNMPASSIVGMNQREILGEEIYGDLQPHITAVLSGEPQNFKTRLTYPDGIKRDMELTYVPHFGEHGEVMGYFTLGVDVTERNELEERLRQAQKMEAVGQLTGGVAHDFNNILAIIIGNLGLIEDGAGMISQPDREAISVTLRAALRGAELTHRLLAFSRQQPLDARTIQINETLPQFCLLAERMLGEDITIELTLAADLWSIMVDAGQLENALLNLATNARDAMPGGGKLTIEATNQFLANDNPSNIETLDPGDYVMIAVKDSGTGMESESLKRAFEPFFTTKDVGMGSGLGLSMVFGFARQSRGHVSIESRDGEGTTVKIYLPRSIQTTTPEKAVEAPDKGRPTGNETILLVEDEKDVLDFLATALDSLGYTVLQAEDGPAALEIMAASSKIDLLLTDVILPHGMSGRDVARSFRSRHPTSGVLYSSGYTRDNLSSRGQLDDGVALISKPYRALALAQRVREVLDS